MKVDDDAFVAWSRLCPRLHQISPKSHAYVPPPACKYSRAPSFYGASGSTILTVSFFSALHALKNGASLLLRALRLGFQI